MERSGESDLSLKIWEESVLPAGPVIAVIGGKTGSGKTELLRSLINMGRQVIDLEKIALHRGSVFGDLKEKQPSREDFLYDLKAAWLSLKNDRPVWIEEKGPAIGIVGLPDILFKKIACGFIIELDTAFSNRLSHIMEEYAGMEPAYFITRLSMLRKRMGTGATDKAIDHFRSGRFEKCFELLLQFYDNAYENQRKRFIPTKVIKVDPAVFENEAEVIKLEKEISSFYKKSPRSFTAGTI